MKIRTLSLLIPFAAAACDQAPTLSSAPVAPFAISYQAPVASEGFLTGAGGMQLFYRVYGSGPDTAVVLGGGPALPISSFEKDLSPLAHGRTLIFFDARGAGKSQLTTDPTLLGMNHHVADLEAVRAHFGLDEMKLVGHSWGAMVAAFYAAQYPQHVDRMVLVTPGPVEAKYDPEFEAERQSRTDPTILARQFELVGLLMGGASAQPVADCTELFDSFFPAYFHDPANVANLQGAWCPQTDEAASLLLFALFAGRASLGPDWNLVPMLQGIQAPALVIHGTGDPIPAASTFAYADALPNGTLRTIQDAGHFPWAEEPAAFFSAVNTFLRRGNL
ncbi:MAG TPA: alpha/beta hydrolase [Longimicrobium sp.]|nr:alpha/beta hydrolase [Longimicrobium sp.]